MRRAAHHIALALSFVRVGAVFLGPGTGRAHACSCAGSPSSTDELYWPDAVFAGEVIDVEEDTSGGMPPLSPVTLGVEESWKGASEERVVVRGYGPEVSCGIEFREGESYLVHARDNESRDVPLETGFCGATKPLASAEADLAALGPPAVTLSGGELVPTGGPPLVAVTAVALLALALAAAGALVRARRPNS
jgi:hypothetical protein